MKYNIGDYIKHKFTGDEYKILNITDMSYHLLSLLTGYKLNLPHDSVESMSELVKPMLKYKVVDGHEDNFKDELDKFKEELRGIKVDKVIIDELSEPNPMYCSCESPQLKKVCANHVEKIFYDYCECCKKERV